MSLPQRSWEGARAFLAGWDARLQQSAEALGVWSGITSIGGPTRFRCRGPLERRSGTPSDATLRQPLLKFTVSPVVPPQRTGSLSRLGGGKGGRPGPALPLPGLDPHVLCAGGEGCPSRVHGCTTATAAELHLSPFGLVQSRIEGLGHAAPDTPAPVPAGRRGAPGPPVQPRGNSGEPPLQCSGQGQKVSLVRFVQVEQHPCCRTLKGRRKVDGGVMPNLYRLPNLYRARHPYVIHSKPAWQQMIASSVAWQRTIASNDVKGTTLPIGLVRHTCSPSAITWIAIKLQG
ncbi:unnamed protein product [Boreogadus saida]